MRRIRSLLMAVSLMIALIVLPHIALSEAAVVSAPLVTNASARNGMVRVYLSSIGSPTSLTITVDGSYTADGAQNVTLNRGDQVTVAFNTSTGQLTMTHNGKSYAMGRELVFRRHATDGNNGLRIAQAKKPTNLYPGDLHLTAISSGGSYKLYPILHVYIEAYLTGVLPYEMGNSAHIEALKAQAVAARTYTLNKMNTRSGYLYDVVDTTSDQVYYGNSSGTANCTAAVNATKGIVVMNGASLTSTYYTASNGGQTESAQNAWGSGSYSYLTIRDDPFDKANAASSKKQTVVCSDFNATAQNSKLKSLIQTKVFSALSAKGISTTGASIKTIDAVTPHTPKYAAPSRLYTKMDFDVTVSTTSGTKTVTVTFDIFTELESPLSMSINSAKNELWSVEQTKVGFTITARRFGHGVGLSQRGAMQMGAMGYTYDQVLGFYYPGCRRVQNTFTHTILGGVKDAPDSIITTPEDPAELTEGACHATVHLSGAGDRLAIRDAATSSGHVLTSVVNGGMVSVLKKGSDWTLVKLGLIVGYVPTSALNIQGEPPQSASASVTRVSKWATVNCTGTLNLRSSSSYNGSVLTTIPSGTVLCVFDVSGEWAHVQYGAVAGYVATSFLRLTDTYPERVVTGEKTTAVVTIPGGSGTVNLRASASSTAKILTTIRHGEPVTVTSSDGSWSNVSWNGCTGWVMDRYLTRAQDAPPTPAPTEPPLPQTTLTPLDFDGITFSVEAIVQTPSGTLNLRAEAKESAEIVIQLPRGASVLVDKRGEIWCGVRYGTLYGFVRSEYLRFPGDPTPPPTGDYATVTTSSGSLNLRSQAKTGSAILTTIPRGTRISVLARGAEWTQVTYGGKTGYVMTKFLTFDGQQPVENQPAENPQPAPEQLFARVTTPSGSLNLRQEPSKNAKVLTTIPQGTQLLVLRDADGWYQTSYNGKTGYVMASFLIIGDAPAPQVTPAPEKTEAAMPAPTSPPTNEPADPPAATASPTPVPEEDAQKTFDLEDAPPQIDVELFDFPAEQPTEATATPPATTTRPTAAPTAQPVFDPTMEDDGEQWEAVVDVTDGTLNVRVWCAKDAPLVCTLEKGQVVEVLEIGREWCHIIDGRNEGYCMTRYLTLRLAE